MLTFPRCRIKKIVAVPTAKGGDAKFPGVVHFASDFTPHLSELMGCDDAFFTSLENGEILTAGIAFGIQTARIQFFEIASVGKDLPLLSLQPVMLTGFAVTFSEDDGISVEFQARLTEGVSALVAWLEERKFYSGVLKAENLQANLFAAERRDENSPKQKSREARVAGVPLPKKHQAKRTSRTPISTITPDFEVQAA